jgi:hypothetical protein
MPTIANMPAADIDVEFPSGTTRTVNMIRLLVQTQNAEFKAKFGMFLPSVGKLHPTIKALREEYEIPAKTWDDAAKILRQMHNELTEIIRTYR